jgi:hypothetical protein
MKISFELPDRKYEQLIQSELAKDNPDYIKLKKMLLGKATELFKEGKDHFPYLYASKLFDLLIYKDNPSQKIEISGVGDCKYCKSQFGKTFTISEAINLMPLPHKECENKNWEIHKVGLCLCSYKPVIEEVEEKTFKFRVELPRGKAIRKIKREMRKSSPDYLMLKMMCFDEALRLYFKGEDHFGYAQASRWFELSQIKYDGLFSKVEILAKGACDVCSEFNGRIYDLDEALETMPIPHKNCTTFCDLPGEYHSTGWCRCIWLPVIED